MCLSPASRAMPSVGTILKFLLRPKQDWKTVGERAHATDGSWPLCKSCHNGHYEKTPVMRSPGQA